MRVASVRCIGVFFWTVSSVFNSMKTVHPCHYGSFVFPHLSSVPFVLVSQSLHSKEPPPPFHRQILWDCSSRTWYSLVCVSWSTLSRRCCWWLGLWMTDGYVKISLHPLKDIYVGKKNWTKSIGYWWSPFYGWFLYRRRPSFGYLLSNNLRRC